MSSADKKHFHKEKRNNFCASSKLSEADAGITEYISDFPEIVGVIKERFSDFHVHEINYSGVVAKLTNLEVPPQFLEDPSEEINLDCPSELVSPEIWERLKVLVESPNPKPYEIDVTKLSKEERTRIHEVIKKTFGKKVVSSTKTFKNIKVIEVKKYKRGIQKDHRIQWPKGLGEYVYFLVYKEAMDTLQASFKIADCLKMNSASFTYAGVKDKRAKTTQWFCLKKIQPRKLLNCCRHVRNIRIGNLEFRDKPLSLGHLKGNKFSIAIRNVTADDELINKVMDSVKTKGFINYFGLQRFGNDKEVPTYEIGIKLLQGNWKEACNLILKVRESDDPYSEVTKAKTIYNETSNSELACDAFRRLRNKCVESKLLIGLAKNGSNDYVSALESIPRNMRLLYLHSFQSIIWNKMVSRRIKEFGLKPTVGDLVFASDKVPELDESNDGPVHPEVKILSENDLKSYTIYDIVMPLPGFDVVYPENEIKTWYAEMLQSYNLSLAMPQQKVKTYNLSGAYRKILNQVNDFSYKILRYNDPHATLIRSDIEELEGYTEPDQDPTGTYKGIVVEFSLTSSSYATMALREILKIDTSSATQAQLNLKVEPIPEGLHQEPETDRLLSDPDSLLANPEKLDAFKEVIMEAGVSNSNTQDGLKRKHDGEEDLPTEKKIKSDD